MTQRNTNYLTFRIFSCLLVALYVLPGCDSLPRSHQRIALTTGLQLDDDKSESADTKKNVAVKADLKTIRERVRKFAKMRKEREEKLSSMSEANLISELSKESDRGLVSYNSMAFRATVARKGQIARKLAAFLIKPRKDRQAFLLGLLALRKMDPALYKEVPSDVRIKILTRALGASDHYNEWGLPHRGMRGEAARALIEEKDAALPALEALLAERRKAHVWGAREPYDKYQYRVRDYAWALHRTIDGQTELNIHTNPAKRDEVISR